MDEEIKKLKSLLDGGAITKEEFEHLKKQVLGAQNEIPENSDLANHSEQGFEKDRLGDEHFKAVEANFKVSIIRGLKQLHDNAGRAGSNVSSSVSYAVYTQIFLVIGMLIFFFAFIPVAMTIGFGSRAIDEAFGAFALMSLFFLASFICWVKQLIKLDNAGKLMNGLMHYSYQEEGLNLIPDPELIENNGLKIGQEFSGGIISFFDKSRMFAVITTKNELKDKYNYEKALEVCKDYSEGGHKDWFPPSSSELKLILKNLEKYCNIELDGLHWCRDCFLIRDKNIVIEANSKTNIKAHILPIRIAAI